MGRPKKRKVTSESEQHDSSAASRTSPSTLAMSMDSDTGSDRGRRASFDTCQHMSEDTPMDMLSFGSETNVDPKLLAFESDNSQQTCACLASLYLSLEEVRKADDLPFTSRLSVLRHLTTTAAGIVQCQICPTKFLWAMQNSQLLNTLLISLAEGYKKIVQFVEDETRRSEEAHEAKLLFLTEGPKLEMQPQGDSSLGLSLSLDPQDWKSIANKTIKGELFGTAFLETALRNLLVADITQTTFGELLVDIPLLRTLLDTRDSNIPPGDPLLQTLPGLHDSLMRYIKSKSYDQDYSSLPMKSQPFLRYSNVDISSPDFDNILVETTAHLIGAMVISFLTTPTDGFFRGGWEEGMPTSEELRGLFPLPATIPDDFFQHPDYTPLNIGDGHLQDSQAAVWAINRIFGGVPWAPYLNPPTNHPTTGLVNGHAPHREPLWICSDKPGALQGF
ncbi:uncharacterized protein FTOL_12497 [Fusarium torulosum]|uniref:Uncharacterized protein n=1 Tax=Fusarium torulosum TaxID=33205 RepID=A0AAE8SPA0_9HYPO|nr:uncharacterized protein FTOL_12497 [Fusarium torulosum]